MKLNPGKIFLFFSLFVFLFNAVQSQWYIQTTNVNRPYTKIFFANQNRGWAVVSGSYMLSSVGYMSISSNGGTNWVNVLNSSEGLNDFYFIDENTGWMVGNIWTDYTPPVTYIHKTVNGGYNWQIQKADTSWFRTFYSVHVIDNLNIWVTGGREKLLKSTNGGINWIILQDSISIYNNYKIYFQNASTGFITGSHCKIYKTNNNGTNWIIKFQGTSSMYDIFFVNSLTGWCSGTNGSILKTTNAGESWSAQNSGPTNRTIFEVIFLNENTGYYAGGLAYEGYGILGKTTNGGNNWNIEYQGIENYFRSICFIDVNTGWCAGGWQWGNWGIGRIYKTTNGGGIFTEIQEINNNIPNNFSLHQNYPNPFNPTTKIRFDIPPSPRGEGLGVRLIIYDLLGCEVATLVNEQLKPGTYEVEWPAPSEDGSNYASGVYFYTLTAGDPSLRSGQGFTQTKKLILLK